ncbi:DEAD/DEAH box helicase [Candidatus Acidulodesulfobacterium sp. H_13]|uniref:DEAD/DEAH box helicase n=1 Tax=Candidatus Acidulodesulfobacterium sp. H_13 TaxID=3395470 RepID=UPI003AF54EF0
MSVQNKYKILEDLYSDLLQDIGTLIQKGKLSKRFNNINLTDEEIIRLNKAKELCELKIVEYWEERDNETFKSLCSTYFDIAVLFPVNIDNEYFIYEQIKLFAFGYLGENWHFIRQYIKNNTEIFESLSNETDWSKRLLIISFKAIYHLIKKDSWEEINQAVEYINSLRQGQEEFEAIYLLRFEDNSRPYAAAELVALYHFSKSIEILGQYLIEGRPIEPETQINYHTNISKEFANKSGNITLSLLFQFFEGFALKLIRNTIWHSTRGINNWVTKFNEFITKESSNNIFELLYPQKESIVRGELLNPAHRAIVLNLPTSSGKTLIAEYRILQALNQFGGQQNKKAWIAYLVPTKTLVNQIFLQLNNDFGKIGLKIEKASGAIELDGFEQHLVEEKGNQTDFDILVTTYEKMNLLVRQGLGTTEERPLVLTIVDEAHNLEEKTRGLTLELLLSTIKNDCEDVNFLLMTPDISNSNEVVNWLAGDRGKVINLDLDWWQPNERVIGAIQIDGRGRNYDFVLKTLHTNKGTYEIGENIPLLHCEDVELTKSKINSKLKIASHLSAQILDINSPIIVLASRINDTYSIADYLYDASIDNFDDDEDIDLLIRFVESELGEDFPLAKYLKRRIAIHSSALPDEIRFLIEDLMNNKGKLQALVSTTTIAQGINFPVSAVIMGAYNYPFIGSMPVRDFWNLAGRVGRTGQNNMGWIGIAARNDNDLFDITNYVQKASDDLLSQLVGAIDSALQRADEDFARWLFIDERWSAILQYISHLRRQTQQLDEFLSQLEQKLQSTFGYRQLSEDKKQFLKENIRRYARNITVSDANKSDETGFSTVSIKQMIKRLAKTNLTPQDWQKGQLFSEHNNSMRELVGIMMNTYEIRKSIEDITTSGQSISHSSIARLIIDWVNGRTISDISARIFPRDNQAIQKTTKALYKVIANAATWGLAALQKMPTSGIDWDNLSKLEKNKMANLPAYLHYGVNTDEGVLMRKNNVPRSIANKLGYFYKQSIGNDNIFSVTASQISEWLRRQDVMIWNNSVPNNSRLSGEDYKKIWKKLNGK